MHVQTHSISSGALTATLTDFGASLTDLRLDRFDHAMVLGYPNVQDYITDGQYMGAVIGRYANRIAGGHVPWDDTPLTLEQNENGINHLHGGAKGFGHQIWETADITPTSVTFCHQSPDGHAGYPGCLDATATYEVTGKTLRLILQATSDRDTIVNLCHHPYFKLDGHVDITNHRVAVYADHVLVAHDNLVPTGEVAAVAGTRFDVKSLSPVPKDHFNNTYCLHNEQTAALAHAATLQASAVRMDLHTTQPGLHYYTGYKLKPKTIGHHGQTYGPFAGVCLEAQAWPDSCNHSQFPPVRLKAGAQYKQITEYRFGDTSDETTTA